MRVVYARSAGRGSPGLTTKSSCSTKVAVWWITDDEEFCRRAHGAKSPDKFDRSLDDVPSALLESARELAPDRQLKAAEVRNGKLFDDIDVLTLSAPVASQFDLACRLVQEGRERPVVMVAGESREFHGHHGRSWSASPGNVHVSVVLTPERTGDNPGPTLVALPSVAVCDALMGRGNLSPKVKWVNDVLIEDAKIAGVLTHCSFRGAEIGAVVYGVGLNVEVTPAIATDPAVSSATAVIDHAPGAKLEQYVNPLIEALCARTKQWADGDGEAIIERYRSHSAVVGRLVDVIADPRPQKGAKANSTGLAPQILRTGRVTQIDQLLQVHLDDNDDTPVRSGRLVLRT